MLHKISLKKRNHSPCQHCIGLKRSRRFGLKKDLSLCLKNFGLKKSLSLCLNNFGLKKDQYQSQWKVWKRNSVHNIKTFCTLQHYFWFNNSLHKWNWSSVLIGSWCSWHQVKWARNLTQLLERYVTYT